MKLEVKKIKTVDDVWAVYEAAGLTKPKLIKNNLFKDAEILKKLLDRITELEAQRDELLKALLDIMNYHIGLNEHPSCIFFDSARNAVEKVTGIRWDEIKVGGEKVATEKGLYADEAAASDKQENKG